MRTGLKTGHNVDAIDVAAGLRELAACGYHEAETVMVIEYALMRWARGEEEAAQRGAIDQSWHGISATCWYRVLGAAMAAAQEPNAELSGPRPLAAEGSRSNDGLGAVACGE